MIPRWAALVMDLLWLFAAILAFVTYQATSAGDAKAAAVSAAGTVLFGTLALLAEVNS